MNVELARHRVLDCLAANRKCNVGLFGRNKVFVCERGPTGSSELLTLIHADDRYGDRFWYGHISRPFGSPNYIAVLVWSTKLVNASSEGLLFRRFNYWTRIDPQFEPCFVRRSDEAYAERADFQGATEALASMIEAFDPDALSDEGESGTQHGWAEMRILSVYGIEGLDPKQYQADGPPFDYPLRIVGRSKE